MARHIRDNAGTGPKSFKKHEELKRLIQAQAYAYHVKHKRNALVFIDTNAGDGHGVPLPQMDLFEETTSTPTPTILVSVQQQLGGDLIFCESHPTKRRALALQYPDATILRTHNALRSFDYRSYGWAMVISDPCGPADMPMEALIHISTTLSSDFILVHNEAAINAINAVPLTKAYVGQDRYGWMNTYQKWRQCLDRRYLSYSPLIKASGRFHYRILLLANGLSSVAKRFPWEQLP